MRKSGESVHHTVRRLDGSMSSLSKIVRRFGAPKGVDQPLWSTKKAVGDVIAKLEMIERRS